MTGNVSHQTCALLWSQDITIEGSHLRERGREVGGRKGGRKGEERIDGEIGRKKNKREGENNGWIKEMGRKEWKGGKDEWKEGSEGWWGEG